MDELEDRSSNWMKVVAIIVAVALAAGAIGYIGLISGTGWFGHRQLLYGTGQLYLLNLGADPLEVTVEGREPVDVPPEDARIVDIVGGESQVIVRNAKGERVATHSVFTDKSHALLKLTKDGCLVASDVGAFYGRGGDQLEFVEMIGEEQQKYVPGTQNVIWPRQSFPAKMSREKGQAMWVELVACPLLKEKKFLRAYLDVRLNERLKKSTGQDEPPPRRR